MTLMSAGRFWSHRLAPHASRSRRLTRSRQYVGYVWIGVNEGELVFSESCWISMCTVSHGKELERLATGHSAVSLFETAHSMHCFLCLTNHHLPGKQQLTPSCQCIPAPPSPQEQSTHVSHLSPFLSHLHQPPALREMAVRLLSSRPFCSRRRSTIRYANSRLTPLSM